VSIQFVYGLAGAGKTQHCVDAIVAALEREAPVGRLLLIVPEQASLQTERRLADAMSTRGFAGTQVLSFTRLAEQVLSESVLQPQILLRTARMLALQSLAAQREQHWRYYRNSAQWPGFFEQLERMVESLLLEGVAPDDLARAGEKLPDPTSQAKAEDIADIYREYIDWLGSERLDPAQRQQALVKCLSQCRWLRTARIWIDGFAFFDALTQQTIVTLARLAREVTLTLLCDPDGLIEQEPAQTHVFQRTLLTRLQLRRELAAAGVEPISELKLKPARLHRFAADTALDSVEQVWRTQLPCREPLHAPGLTLHAADSSREELRAVARHIRGQVAQSLGTLRFSDFAVIARDLRALATQVQEVFDDFQVPYFLDQRRALGGHPLAHLVQVLVEAAGQTRIEPCELTGLLHNPLLPLDRTVREALAQEALLGSDGDWNAPQNPFERTIRRPRVAAPVRDAWRQLRAALDPLVQTARSGRVAGTHWATVLQGVLQGLGVDHRLTDWIQDAHQEGRWEAGASHQGAWKAVMTLLEELHTVLGEQSLSLGELRQVLRLAIAERSYAIAPPMLDQVLVAAIDRSRHPEVRHAWVIGMNEGHFPAPPPDDTLLSTLERTTLSEMGLRAPQPGIQKALDEQMLAYIAFTRPSESLTISYAHQGTDGSALEPSPFVERLQALMPGLKVQRLPEHPLPVTLSDAADQALRRDVFGKALHKRLQNQPEFAEAYAWLARGQDYGNKALGVPPFRRPVDAEPGVVWHASVTELQSYLNCPFQHLAKYGLRLEAPVQAGKIEHRSVGILAHRILAETIRLMLEQSQAPSALEDVVWLDVLAQACESNLGAADAPWRARDPEASFCADRLAERLQDVILTQVARYRRGDFEPHGCEIAVGGQDSDWPAVTVGLADEQRVTLHGRLDRVDVAENVDPPMYMVCDYKQKQKDPLRSDPLQERELQLVLYALAVKARHPDWRWVGVQVTPYAPELSVLSKGHVVDESRDVQTQYLFRPRGWILTEAVEHLDRVFGAAPSITMQLKRTKTGALDSYSDDRDQDFFGFLHQMAEVMTQHAAKGVSGGSVPVLPLVVKKRLACKRCDFERVCRFDRRFNDPFPAEALLNTQGGDA
jgi:ATP-dependent helicase/nuclease subunit B